MAVHLVRHGDAGSHRKHDDESRPLSDKGRRQAKAVRDELADLPVDLDAAPGDVVVCSHGNVLSSILDRVHRRGIEVVADEWTCRKGSVWRLETDGDGVLVRAVLALRPG
jgi:broad specificity phosphatase PhoE